jgi:hypothetical protein
VSESGGGGERDEELAWLLAREQGEQRPPPTPELGARHDRLIALIEQLPIEPAPDLVRARTLQAIEAADAAEVAARRRRKLAIGALGIAAAAAVLFLILRQPRRDQVVARLEAPTVQFRSPGHPRGSSRAVGDIATLRGVGGASELRLYLDDDRIVIRCPGDPGCSVDTTGAVRAIVAEVTLALPGRYRSLILRGEPVPPPTGRLDDDVAAAIRAHVEVMAGPPFEVQ